MISLALNERRGMVLYFSVGALLIFVVLHELFISTASITLSPAADVYGRSFEFFAQIISALMWGALCTLVALTYTRIFFNSPRLWEVIAAAGIVATALFPISYISLGYALLLLNFANSPIIALEAPRPGYALAMLFVLLILGVLLLVSKEGMRAARSNHASHGAV